MESYDWAKCCICQRVTREDLKCPVNAKGPSEMKKEVYVQFIEAVNNFKDLGRLPDDIAIVCPLTADTLMAHKAYWHKSCRKKFASDRLERAKRKRDNALDVNNNTLHVTKSKRVSYDNNTCIFCLKCNGHMHLVCTLEISDSIQQMASALDDHDLWSRIAISDLVALGGKYHLSCLTSYRNNYRSVLRLTSSQKLAVGTFERENKAFEEVTNFITEKVDDGTYLFRLSELRSLSEQKLKYYGYEKTVNKIIIKERILQHFPNANERTVGKWTIIWFNEVLDDLVNSTFGESADKITDKLSHAATVVRQDICTLQTVQFNGRFQKGCQKQSVPEYLKQLVSMILFGAKRYDREMDSQACLTVSQFILFNSRGMTGPSGDSFIARETPLPVYIGLNLHTQTRSRKLIDQLNKLGICIGYKRILQLENQLTNAVCEQALSTGIVCPPQLRTGIFTVGAIDNIDHNPSSTTAKGSFHGTGISLFQFPTTDCEGELQQRINILSSDDSTNHELPDDYTKVEEISVDKSKLTIPSSPNPDTNIQDCISVACDEERAWISHVARFIGTSNCDSEIKADRLSWSAYHAAKYEESENIQEAIGQLMPLFNEKAASASMIKHALDVQKIATNALNPGQIIVTAVDAPLYAIAKQIQWKWPEAYGEDSFVIMLGGLHIEMAIWKTLGDYLAGSGWTEALVEAEIASSGTAESFLKVTHLTRTRQAHQVTACALGYLKQKAFESCSGDRNDINELQWEENMNRTSPTFHFWSMLLRFEIAALLFIRSHRERNFSMYVKSLKAIIPLFFALDHQNYARWVAVHIRDMEKLPFPVAEQFTKKGNFVVKKTKSRFSSIPIDQAHEQHNETIKGSGGAVGLTENPAAFRKWMIAGPEQARIISEFEDEYEEKSQKETHHEECASRQDSFREKTTSLLNVVNEMGNPFLEKGPDLMTLDDHVIARKEVVKAVYSLEDIGKQQYQTFVKEVLDKRTKSFLEPIKKNTLPLMNSTQQKKTKQIQKTELLRKDCELFSRLYITNQNRKGDINSFFKHENHPFPPALSENNCMRHGNKSDILLCFPISNVTPTSFDVTVIDGAVIVSMLPTSNVSTFDEFAEKVFMQYLREVALENSSRVDVVFDRYFEGSLKAETQQQRGEGKRRKVMGKTKLPNEWQQFLRNPTNKEELFEFLAQKINEEHWPEDKTVNVTAGPTVLTNNGTVFGLCDHEEADTRMVLHLKDAIEHGAENCLVRTVDSDVVVILVGLFSRLAETNSDIQIFVAFGSGSHFRHYHINGIVNSLGTEKAAIMPFFHALSGCDTTSVFHGKGKKTAWNALESQWQFTKEMKAVSETPFLILDEESELFIAIERFTYAMYDRTSEMEDITCIRKYLFCRRNRKIENVPPTRNALLQHSMRAVYQASIWYSCLLEKMNAPSAEGFGWTRDPVTKMMKPVWTTIPVVMKALKQLISCGCNTPCKNARCSCTKAMLPCTPLCKCACEL